MDTSGRAPLNSAAGGAATSHTSYAVPAQDSDDGVRPLSRRRLIVASVGVLLGAHSSVAAAAAAAHAQGPAPLPEWPLARLRSLAARLNDVQNVIGQGRFNLVSFADVRAAARQTAQGALTAAEESSCRELFHLDARRIGFLGARVVRDMNYALPQAELLRVDGGQHLFPAASALFARARAAVGPQLIVTSGARGVPKQMLVFLRSALRAGIIARPVHSVAPPGYSYHAVGDMDVGDRALGGANFTAAFANSATYRKLIALPYVRLRYPRNNALGVSFEPWHLQVYEQ